MRFVVRKIRGLSPFFKRRKSGIFPWSRNLFLATALLLMLPQLVNAAPHEIREVHYQMGTYLAFTVWDADEARARDLIRQSVAEVHRLETVLAKYDPENDLSRFNDKAGRGKTKLAPDLYDILKIAVEFGAVTNGTFDVTVGPLVELWRASLSRGFLPAEQQLLSARKNVGYRKPKLFPDRDAELAPEMKIDLGGIGKGYAVDRIANLLKGGGVDAALIDFGGSSIYGFGAPAD